MKIHPIIEIPLNKEKLYDNVIRQIANDSENIIFSKTTKKIMIKFIENDIHDNAFILWENLLIDAICLLKINDKRERLYDDFKKIYEENKNSFSEKFTKIRLMTSYGIDELGEYFNDFISFEKILYGTNKHYRDHLFHLIQVWALGIGILCNNEKDLVLNDGYICSTEIFHFLIKENEKAKCLSKSEIWAMWTVIALCHDLGYPIEKASKINQETRKIVNHFGCLNFQELNYSFEIFNGYIVEKFLNIISSRAINTVMPNDNFNKIQSAVEEKDNKINKTIIQPKYHDKFSKSLEDFRHGMFSGLLIFKKLTYFLETDYYIDIDSKLTDEDLRQFYIRREILRSICGHTCEKIYHIHLNTLPFLLILCDEIQEWNRPNFDELRFRVAENEPTVQLMKCDLKVEEFSILFTYDFDIKLNYKKHLVLDRFKTLHYLLRSAKDDKDRKISFCWTIEFNDMRFSLNFISAEGAFKNITLKKTKKDNNGEWLEDIEFDLYESKEATSI